eukprot:evm.model.scf_238EXC.1 EVM.evm.TU.scf_238EXC.1   scf_238EXC:2099-7356(+)
MAQTVASSVLSGRVVGASTRALGRSRVLAAGPRRLDAQARHVQTTCVQTPLRMPGPSETVPRIPQQVNTAPLEHRAEPLLTAEALASLEAQLAGGEGVAALRRFNAALCKLTPEDWEEKLQPIFNEWCYNLESFNPAFAAVVLKVQSTIGHSWYFRRDAALKQLIQPLAGEYGMHNDEPQAKTHRELFSNFYESLFEEPLERLLEAGQRPIASELLFEQMMRDINGGGECTDLVEQASYALGYNLAIEFLADYEKTWMIESFQELNRRIFGPLGKKLDWVFMEIHAEDEKVHAEIGHDAVLSFVPAAHEATVLRAMRDHDRDFAVFYNKLASELE